MFQTHTQTHTGYCVTRAFNAFDNLLAAPTMTVIVSFHEHTVYWDIHNRTCDCQVLFIRFLYWFLCVHDSHSPLRAVCPVGNFPGASSGHPHVSGSDVDLACGFYNHF